MTEQTNEAICDWIAVLKNDILSQLGAPDIVQFIQNYPPLLITKELFKKRKRQKTIVPIYERCMALSSSKKQCTRRRKKDEDFCGTHLKGRPNGTIQQTKETSLKTINVFTKDIKGIIYYMDDSSNIYHPQDIFENRVNPRVVLKYEKHGDDYTIIDLN